VGQEELDVVQAEPNHTNMLGVNLCVQGGVAYSLPGQFLGPTENGCIASLLSLSYFFSPSQRSGAKANGSVKFCVAVLIQYWLIQTTVCVIPSQFKSL
jgi:hypothetical protein